jgi:hypothetical protein
MNLNFQIQNLRPEIHKPKFISPFFSALSLAYIAGIFLLADSPVVSDVAPFNPYSLLHIPLYGILTLLLILSFSPFKLSVIKRGNRANLRNQPNATNSTDPINPINPINSRNCLIAGSIALGVAVADEIHQAYIPSRQASVTDVFLDIVGIILCIVFIKRIEEISWFSKKMDFLRRTTLEK